MRKNILPALDAVQGSTEPGGWGAFILLDYDTIQGINHLAHIHVAGGFLRL
jgi:hypothetical protein